MLRRYCALLLLLLLAACSAPVRAEPTRLALPETPPPLTTRTLAAPSTPPPSPTPTATPRPTNTLVPQATRSIAQLPYRVVGYYPAWTNPARDPVADELPGDRLTHVIYAFAGIEPKKLTCTGDTSLDQYHLKKMRQLKQKYPHVKVLIALGGAANSALFSDMAAEDKTRRAFVTSCLDLYVGAYPEVVDGFDMDWEFPGVGEGTRKEDKQNYTLLMKEFRRQLDDLGAQKNRSYVLTAATPAGPWLYDKYELKELAAIVDWFNLMTYDFHGVWSKETNFTAPLYRSKDDPYPLNNVDAAVQGYLKAGVLPHKITLGIPFYGRGWTTANTDDHGLYQKIVRGDVNGKAYTYRNLADNFIGQNDYVRLWDYGAKVPWLFNPTDRVFITYEDPESIGYKADYIAAHFLGGAMIWHLSSDNDSALLNALFERLAQ